MVVLGFLQSFLQFIGPLLGSFQRSPHLIHIFIFIDHYFNQHLYLFRQGTMIPNGSKPVSLIMKEMETLLTSFKNLSLSRTRPSILFFNLPLSLQKWSGRKISSWPTVPKARTADARWTWRKTVLCPILTKKHPNRKMGTTKKKTIFETLYTFRIRFKIFCILSQENNVGAICKFRTVMYPKEVEEEG